MMTGSNNANSIPNNSLIGQCCAITFKGNASNNLQQDAFFLLDDWYQENLGITEVIDIKDYFCLAVSDGVASSSYSQHCSKAIVKAIDRLRSDSQQVTVNAIQKQLDKGNYPIKCQGAAATLACLEGLVNDKKSIKATITHVGDSRIYRLSKDKPHWQCLTRDHNLLNEMLEEKAEEEGLDIEEVECNLEGMASSLYAITEFFVLTPDKTNPQSVTPNSTTTNINIYSGDVFVICTDGIHDLVPSQYWPSVDQSTDLQQWLIQLKSQVYKSEGRAYDNGTAIIIRFD